MYRKRDLGDGVKLGDIQEREDVGIRDWSSSKNMMIRILLHTGKV